MISLSCMVSACGFQTYVAKPIDLTQTSKKLALRSISDADFQAYLIAQDYPKAQLPISLWGENELTLSALYFHPDLNLARAQWRAAQAAQITAAQRPEIGVNGGLENHSQSSDKSPWTYRLGIDVTIVTAGKREAQIAQAAGLSEAARIEIAQTAWQVHSRLAKSLLAYQYALAQSASLKSELALRTSIADMLMKRMDAGMASSIELSNARIALQKAEQAYMTASGQIAALGATLASNAGLSLTAFNQLNIKPFEVSSNSELQALPYQDLQYEALFNRLDIRAALARYEAAEAKLRLEIARQYPDITLSPAKALDQGDKIWSLGFSSLLTLLNKNRGMIAEANALRDVEVAQFEVLQAQVIGQLDEAKAMYQAALESKLKAQAVLAAQEKRTQQTERQFNAGFADRLEFTSTQLENIVALQSTLNTAYQAQLAKLNLEDVLQRPLDKRLTLPSQLEASSNNADRNSPI